jgi:ABC-type nitrate/sulfonate/bicarbonate transport system substrate-binding protein
VPLRAIVLETAAITPMRVASSPNPMPMSSWVRPLRARIVTRAVCNIAAPRDFAGKKIAVPELESFFHALTRERLGRFDIDFRKVTFIRGYVPTPIIYRRKPRASSVPTRYLVRMDPKFAAEPTINPPIPATETE